MDTSDWIALLSFLGALLSALYARWTFNEAKKANKIAIHQHQIEIFDSFTDLMSEIHQLGENFSLETLNKFSARAYTADLYLSNELSSKIKQYNQFAHNIYLRSQMNRTFLKNGNAVPKEDLQEVWSNTDKCREIEGVIEEKLREELKLQKP